MSKKDMSGVHRVFQGYEHKDENPEFVKNIEASLEDFEKQEFVKVEKKEMQRAKEEKIEEKKTAKIEKNNKKKLPFLADVCINIIVLALLLFVFRTYIFSPFNVSGPSMESTLQDKEFIYVDKIIPSISGFSRGQVIVFFPPTDTMTDEKGLMCIYDKIKNTILFEGLKNPCRVKASFVKRIIGIPGDRVEIENGNVFVTPEGGEKQKVSEQFLNDENKDGTCIPADRCGYNTSKEKTIYAVVPEGKFFVLGDNRKHSSDSRSNRWDSHFIDEDQVVGVARAVFLSPKKFDQNSVFIDKISNILESFSGIRTIPTQKLFEE